ncbi:MAG: hypothetical protein N3A38_10040 [Planctomycetota bacterium]|nr:hypothetical protein [Planctomycetota bacterium]
MPDHAFPEIPWEVPHRAPGVAIIEADSEAAFAYGRIKEFLGIDIDDIAGRETTRSLVRDLFRMHLAVRDPKRLERLPPGPGAMESL